MKPDLSGRSLVSAAVVMLMLASSVPSPQAGIWDFLKRSRNALTNASETGILSGAVIPQQQIAEALKEALAQGVKHAVNTLGQEGGFLNNLDVRIPIPDQMKRVESTLRMFKQDRLADEFIATMNHAAENAVPEAGQVFSQAIQQLTLEDVQSLWKGKDTAVTDYFRKTSTESIKERMRPIIEKSTSQAGVTAKYKQLTDKAKMLTPLFGRDSASLNLDDYITSRAAEGLFQMIGQEERRIRENPAARTTDLLKKVFGAARSSTP